MDIYVAGSVHVRGCYTTDRLQIQVQAEANCAGYRLVSVQSEFVWDRLTLICCLVMRSILINDSTASLRSMNDLDVCKTINYFSHYLDDIDRIQPRNAAAGCTAHTTSTRPAAG